MCDNVICEIGCLSKFHIQSFIFYLKGEDNFVYIICVAKIYSLLNITYVARKNFYRILINAVQTSL